MPEPDFMIRQGDTVSPIYSTLTDEDGVPVDIDGAEVRFKMQSIAGGELTVDAEATIDQVGAGEEATFVGEVHYEWEATDTDTPGLYLAEWQVTFGDASIQTFPNGSYVLVRITPQVAVS